MLWYEDNDEGADLFDDGDYLVTGLQELHDIDGELTWVRHDFVLELANVTALGLLFKIAEEHERIFPGGDHSFIESVVIKGRTITVSMGS